MIHDIKYVLVHRRGVVTDDTPAAVLSFDSLDGLLLWKEIDTGGYTKVMAGFDQAREILLAPKADYSELPTYGRF